MSVRKWSIRVFVTSIRPFISLKRASMSVRTSLMRLFISPRRSFTCSYAPSSLLMRSLSFRSLAGVVVITDLSVVASLAYASAILRQRRPTALCPDVAPPSSCAFSPQGRRDQKGYRDARFPPTRERRGPTSARRHPHPGLLPSREKGPERLRGYGEGAANGRTGRR